MIVQLDTGLPSDDLPEPFHRAGFGGRFRYWRGASGRRYLFTAEPVEALGDFRSVVIMLAEEGPDGRLAGRTLLAVDAAEGADPALVADGQRAFVHFLAATRAERHRLVEDLAAVRLMSAA